MGNWQGQTDEALIAYAETHHSGDFAAAPAMEMQRRLLVAIRDFNTKSGRQANVMIGLTVVIGVLTVAITVLTAVLVWRR